MMPFQSRPYKEARLWRSLATRVEHGPLVEMSRGSEYTITTQCTVAYLVPMKRERHACIWVLSEHCFIWRSWLLCRVAQACRCCRAGWALSWGPATCAPSTATIATPPMTPSAPFAAPPLAKRCTRLRPACCPMRRHAARTCLPILPTAALH